MRTPLAFVFMLAVTARADGDWLVPAQKAYDEGHYDLARDLINKSLDKMAAKESQKAWRVFAASSCFLHDRNSVLAAIPHLQAKEDVEFLKYVCRRSGVQITDDDVAVFTSPARELVEKAQAAYAGAKYLEAKKRFANGVIR